MSVREIQEQIKQEIQGLLEQNGLDANSNAYLFLYEAYVEKRTFSDIANDISEKTATLTQWNKVLEPIWRKITNVRTIHKRKKIATEKSIGTFIYGTQQCKD